MIRFSWSERESTEAEEVLLLVPGDCTFTKVKECPSGRVFSLNFASTPSKRYYYWVQEPETLLTDTEIHSKVSEILSEVLDEEEQPCAKQPKVEQPELGQGKPSQVQGSTVQEQIQSIISAIQIPKKQPTLKEIFSDEDILLLCELPAVKQRLWHTLPESLRESGQSLREIIASAAFRESLALFDEVLKGGEMNAVILSLGLDPAAGTSFGGVKRLLEAIKHKVEFDKANK